MTLKEHLQTNAGLHEEVLEEGLRFFKLSKKLKKSIARLEKINLKKPNPKLAAAIAKLKGIAARVENIENRYKSKSINRASAKIEVKKLLSETISLSKEMKATLGIKVMKKTGLVTAISAILAIAVGVGAAAGLNLDLGSNFNMNLTPSIEGLKAKGISVGQGIENKLISSSRAIEDLVEKPSFETALTRMSADIGREATRQGQQVGRLNKGWGNFK